MSTKFYRIQLECTSEDKIVFINFLDRSGFPIPVSTVHFPNCPDGTPMELYYEESGGEKVYKFTFGQWLKWKEGQENAFSPTEWKRLTEIFQQDVPLDEEIKEESLDFLGKVPELNLMDITETEFFDFNPIAGHALEEEDVGVWAYHGLRKCSMTLSYFPYRLHQVDEVQFTVTAAFVKRGNDHLSHFINLEELTILDDEEHLRLSEGGRYVFHGFFDTNELGNAFKDGSPFAKFTGSFEVTCSLLADHPTRKTTYSFPFSVTVHNTNYYHEHTLPCPRWDEENFVSVDFGTSSTCVAVQRGTRNELLTLSSSRAKDEDPSINLYENPTNIMICNWASIYKQWTSENGSFPHFREGTYDSYRLKEKTVDYNVGYTVSNEMKNPEREALQAILTQIKLVPYALKDGVRMELYPVAKKDYRVVKLVDSPENQDHESLDPVAFYGYLIGRAINDPRHKKIYSKFMVTYPVKFNADMREKLRRSLEYGLKRSLPLPLREGMDKNGNPIFSISMKYSEPEAYIGAICGTEYLSAAPNKPALFAVYDFGGGTLDFSFGMFSVDEDDIPQIDMFGVDGDSKVGAEQLIALISYWIYTADANIEAMARHRIPFMKPEQNLLPNQFPESLLNKSVIAKANVRLVDETFSRRLFQGKIDFSELAVETQIIDLRDENNNPVEAGISLSVDYGVLKDKLEQVLEKSVDKFQKSMELYFTEVANVKKMERANVRYPLENVKIFRAGNASRSLILEEKMKKFFPNNEIVMVDESQSPESYDITAITPKTAVAFGQLRLKDIAHSVATNAPFAWNVYFQSLANGEFRHVLKKNHQNMGWEYFNAIQGNGTELYVSDSLVYSKHDPMFPVKIPGNGSEEKSFLYLRVHTETSIEYFIAEKKVKPEDDLPVNQSQVVVIGQS